MHVYTGPQLFDCNQSKIDGLAFIGLNLSRHSDDTRTNGSSVTRQSQYDFNLLQDRNYDYLQSTNDDGWLVGGGEADDSFKLPSADSGHCGTAYLLCQTISISVFCGLNRDNAIGNF